MRPLSPASTGGEAAKAPSRRLARRRPSAERAAARRRRGPSGCCICMCAVALVVGERALRRVDRDLVEVRRAQPRQLRVEVREQPSLQQRVVARNRCRARCCEGQKATCSVSAKKLSGQRSSTMRPMTCNGTSSSGISLVESRWSNGKASACSCVNSCTASSHSGKVARGRSPRTGRGGGSRGRRRRSSPPRPTPWTAGPASGRQWNLTKVDVPSALTQPEAVDAEALRSCAASAGWCGRT